MDLDRHKLAEERVWRFANYERQVQRTVRVLVDAIETETRRALERDIAYGDDARYDYSYLDQASEIQHAILQAVNNADFRGLTRDAGELHAVEMAIYTLGKLKDQLPAGMRDTLEQAEDQKQLALLEEKVADRDRRRREDAERCRAAVHQGGRGVGFHQCSRKGKTKWTVGRHGDVAEAGAEGAVEVLLCGTHSIEIKKHGRIHVYRPSDWDAKMIEGGRKKMDREIERMRASLPAQLTEGGE